MASLNKASLALGAQAASIAMLAACGALRAPVQFEPVEAAPVEERQVSLNLEAVEGRPQGLLLRLWCDCQLPDEGWLEVLRAEDGGKAQVFRRVRLTADLRAELQDDGVELLDRAVEPDRQLRYQVRLQGSRVEGLGEAALASSPLEVTWMSPPPRPQGVQVDSLMSGTVELRWASAPEIGALIFRRNVLDSKQADSGADTRRIAQLGPAARGVFVDRAVQPGGVYAYRIALAAERGQLVQFGPASDEIYVTVAATPQQR